MEQISVSLLYCTGIDRSSNSGMNSTFNPKNQDRRLHRHVAFFGTMPEVIGDCCEVRVPSRLFPVSNYAFPVLPGPSDA